MHIDQDQSVSVWIEVPFHSNKTVISDASDFSAMTREPMYMHQAQAYQSDSPSKSDPGNVDNSEELTSTGSPPEDKFW